MMMMMMMLIVEKDTNFHTVRVRYFWEDRVCLGIEGQGVFLFLIREFVEVMRGMISDLFVFLVAPAQLPYER